MTLALGIFGDVRLTFPSLYKNEIRESLEKWISWSDLYQTLLSQGRIWDFRDVFLVAIRCFGVTQACQKFFLSDSLKERVIDDWILYERDESTILAQLDILVELSLHVESSIRGDVIEWLQPEAQSLVEEIMEKHPESMKSRPFTRWIVMKAAGIGLEQEDHPITGPHTPFGYLENYPGYVPSQRWPNLPIYIPREFETPVWMPSEFPPQKEAPLVMALDTATQMKDYRTQVLCLKLFILRSQDPTDLFEQLKHLQKGIQGDSQEYLQTCLSSYLICRDKPSQKQLLAEFQDFDDWSESWLLRDAKVYFAKHFIERVLTAKLSDRRSLPPLRRPAMNYYNWLGGRPRAFISSFPSVGFDEHQVPVPASRPRFRFEDDDGEYDRIPRVVAPDLNPIFTAYQAGKEDAKAEMREMNERIKVVRQPAKPAKRTRKVRKDEEEEEEDVVVTEKHSNPSSSSSSYFSSEWESASPSDDSDWSDDYEVKFSHGHEIKVPRKDIDGKKVTIHIQDPKKRGEYTRVTQVKEGDYIYTTTKKRVKDKKHKSEGRHERWTRRDQETRPERRRSSRRRKPSVVRVRGEASRR